MKIKFYSYTPSGNVKFESEGIYNDNTLSFVDKSYQNTTINIEINTNNVHFNRVGECNMDMHLEIGKKCIGHYKTKDLAFDFIAEAHTIEINEKKIALNYELFINNETYGIYKIFIVLK